MSSERNSLYVFTLKFRSSKAYLGRFTEDTYSSCANHGSTSTYMVPFYMRISFHFKWITNEFNVIYNI